MKFSDAYGHGIIKHCTVEWFMLRTYEFLTGIGIDSKRIRFRQHAGTEMAHYASDCWDCEIFGEYGWIECVGIANRTCHDLESHESHSGTNLLRSWRQFVTPKKITGERLSPVGSVIGPVFRQRAGEVSSALSELEEIPPSFPFLLMLKDGSEVEITSDMATITKEDRNVHGEWFTPHVIEPAFGIDRIIWHLLDHSFVEDGKDEEDYVTLRLDASVSPYDLSIMPLFDKEGMVEFAKELFDKLVSLRGVQIDLDTSGSIGKRYARADEIGIPWAVTIDHTTLEDGTVTIRRRDDQVQVRVSSGDLHGHISNSTIGSLF